MATATLDIALGSTLSEEGAREIYAQGPEAVVFALMAMAKMLAEQQAASAATSHQTPSTPSGRKPVYQKPSPSGRGKKKPGRKKGHPGSRRAAPERIDRRETHRAKICPNCEGPLKRCAATRTRYIEDIPEDPQPEVTEHTIPRDWCPPSRKKV